MAIKQTEELERALQAASDRGNVSAVLLIPNEPVSFRIAGGIERSEGEALSPEQIRDIAAAAVGEDRLDQIGAGVGQAMTSCALPGVMDGRLCVSRSLGSYSITVRVLPRLDFTDLAQRIGVPSSLVDAAMAPGGLILVSGPADSGKTTTQYALLNELNNRRACHICTVEYMVGMLLPARRAIVQQREIGVDVPDCMAGIGASMAQDPDVLFVGELRAVEELEACIGLASLGRLVITQLHLPTPQRAIERVTELVDDNARRQFARCLRAVSAQHLMRRADGRGHIAAFGVLVPDEPMRRAIAGRQDLPDDDAELSPGSISLAKEIARLVDERVISEATARETLARLG